ncbi:DUF397 domain-containing protein [Nocardia terpenica]|uniref:DUF397 domain-containing protein n=1 Tax=Nocardia terpenica TaxID=455432 RepID=UPI00189491D8|nr:DUF397 domain-containing protein [Nocardia terpenica]MBF6063722.1 DUF397 domain-containing protein [Nocardia terpenica]MBF6107098.1 DUF397 domain-containing protein [Nocardia terpenica]MBF6114271.1 DUF397 domain-containing protein [Nocardia terpenica]MBF6121642.1 DUF397 domain-containing protein [Nocardia terpenica]MBF6154057.1 DUF397 domain-containing protein [Nocardia terpenica]
MGTWRKSSFSTGSDHCVEVLFTDAAVSIRDSKYLRNPVNDPAAQPIITVPTEHWDMFLQLAVGRLDGEFPGLPSIEHHDDGGVSIRSEDGITLSYTPAEWIAYVSGIRAGEFAAA